MALNPVRPLYSASATATNGSATVTVTGNVNCSFLSSGSIVSIGTRQLVDAISGTAPDGSGNSTITLRRPWADPTTTGPLLAFMSYEGLADAVRRLREIIDAGEVALSSSFNYAGLWDASGGNFPATPAAGLGSVMYTVSVTGTMGGRAYRAGEPFYYDQTALSWRSFFELASAFSTGLLANTTAANWCTALGVLQSGTSDAQARTNLQNDGRFAQIANIQTNAQRQLLEAIAKKATLSLDFAGNKHRIYEPFGLTDKLITEALATTRASTATYNSPFGVATAAANIPRIEYNPTTGECSGLLCEEQRTNLVVNSDIGKVAITPPWQQATGLQTSTIGQKSPDGGNNAVLFNDTDTGTVSALRQIIAITSSTNTYQCSVYAKAGTTGKCYLRMAIIGGSSLLITTVFDFATKTFSGGSGTSFTELADGWFRLNIALTDNASGNTSIDYRIGATENIVGQTGTVLLFGAQVEIGSFPTSYIPTEASQVTRIADQTIATPTHNEKQFSVLAEILEGNLSAVNRILGIGTSGINRIELNSGGLVVQVNNEPAQSISFSGGFLPKTRYKIAYTFLNGVVKFAVNGVMRGTTVATITKVLTSAGIKLSSATSGTQNASAVFSNISYYPRALSDAELQELTRL